ncbi:hypothetical protein ACFP6B_02315 [Rothia nasimurium]|uniref:hypothetical protein n=1 Tax=Rothia nasimurium TaxID=85336 RepID=UPI00361F7769
MERPVVLASASIPAYAASSLTCQTLSWPTSASSTSKTLTNGSYTVTVTQSRTAGANSLYNGASSDMVAAAAGSQVGTGTANTGTEGNGYTVGSTTSSVLTLNQRTNGTRAAAAQTLTFTITDSSGKAVTPKSISFNIYDVTGSSGGTNANSYGDVVTLSNATWQLSNFLGYAQSDYTTASSTQLAMTTVRNLSLNTVTSVTATVTPTSNSFSLTYSNGNASTLQAWTNNQYIGIGDITIC